MVTDRRVRKLMQLLETGKKLMVAALPRSGWDYMKYSGYCYILFPFLRLTAISRQEEWKSFDL